MTRWEPSNVSSKYGAPMGRDVSVGFPSGKVSLQRVRINSGGYDSGGAYWGIGEPLYRAADDSGEFEVFVRAADRESAKSAVRRQFYPFAMFYR